MQKIDREIDLNDMHGETIFFLLYNHVHQNVALFTLNIIKNSKWLQHKYFGKYSIL